MRGHHQPTTNNQPRSLAAEASVTAPRSPTNANLIQLLLQQHSEATIIPFAARQRRGIQQHHHLTGPGEHNSRKLPIGQLAQRFGLLITVQPGDLRQFAPRLSPLGFPARIPSMTDVTERTLPGAAEFADQIRQLANERTVGRVNRIELVIVVDVASPYEQSPYTPTANVSPVNNSSIRQLSPRLINRDRSCVG